MNAKACLLILMLSFGLSAAHAQGFAGLGSDAEGFSIPAPGTPFDFPRDHGSHPDYRIEWWYVTATLTGEDGRDYGVQWTLFRSALAPTESAGLDSPQIWMGQAGLTTPDAHYVAERFARGGIGQAGVVATPFSAWIDEWTLEGPTLNQVNMRAQGTDFAYDLDLISDRPFVPQGADGYSVKSREGQASYYYSQPFYTVTGTLTLPDGPLRVTGNAWLDREWSSQPLAADQTGWDWFSLSFDGGAKLMGFRLRQTDGSHFSSGTWIGPDGTVASLGDGAITATPQAWTPVAGREVPTAWALSVAEKGVDVTVTALNPYAWMAVSVPYWEGPVIVTGSHMGRGYLEMTGYE